MIENEILQTEDAPVSSESEVSELQEEVQKDSLDVSIANENVSSLLLKGKTKAKTVKNIERLLAQRNEQTTRAEDAEGELSRLRGKLSDYEAVETRVREEMKKTHTEEKFREELFRKHPSASTYAESAEKICEEIPNLSFDKAMRIAAPHLFVDEATKNLSEAEKLSTSSRSPYSLRSERTTSNMSVSELENVLRREEEEGNLNLNYEL